MNAAGWLYRVYLAALVVVILAVVVGLGWVGIPWPGLVFYVGAALVGLLAWWNWRGRAKQEPERQTDEVETTSPG